jgi:hypothetical protein
MMAALTSKRRAASKGRKNSKKIGQMSFKQCCGSGTFIPDPDFYPSRIPDPRSKNSYKREG